MKKSIIPIALMILLTIFIAIFVYAALDTPIITVTSPATNTWHNTRSPLINFSVAGNATAFACYIWSNDTGTWHQHNNIYYVNNNTESYITDANFNEKSLFYGIWCNDTINGVSNLTSTNRTINIDVTPPQVFYSSISDNYFVDSNRLLFNVTSIDANAGTCRLYVSSALNSSYLYTTNTNLSFNYNSSVNGTTYLYYVTCNDSAGNLVQLPTRTAYFGRKPSVILTSPATNGYSTEDVNLTVSSSGASSIYTCYVYSNDTGNWTKDGGAVSLSNGVTTGISKKFTAGAIIWNLECFETGSRYPYVMSFAEANFTVITDSTAPSVSIQSPPDNYYSGYDSVADGYTFRVNLTVTDTNPNTCNLTVNGRVNRTNASITSGTSFFMSFNATDGSFNWSIICDDKSGNKITTSNRTYHVDTSNPRLTGSRNYSYSGNCNGWYLDLNFSEAVNYTIKYGKTVDASGSTVSSSSFLGNVTAILSFDNMSYDTTHYINVSFCDRYGNCNDTAHNTIQLTAESPVPLCSGWSVYSIYDKAITMSQVYSNSTADYVYFWNNTGQNWLYKSSAITTYDNQTLGWGDVVHLYTSTDKTWMRNHTDANNIKYRYNISTGHNFMGLYYSYSMGNLSDYMFRNATGGNKTLANYSFQIDFFNGFNNSAKSYVTHIYKWSWNNNTELGSSRKGIDTLHVYSVYNLTINMTVQGGGFIYENRSI